MAWRCVGKKSDGTKCKAAVAKRGSRCRHHKRKRAARKKPAKKSGRKKATRRKAAGKKRCTRILISGRRCKCYCKPGGVYCATHKGSRKKKRARRNPRTPVPFSKLDDRWSIPKLPAGVIK